MRSECARKLSGIPQEKSDRSGGRRGRPTRPKIRTKTKIRIPRWSRLPNSLSRWRRPIWMRTEKWYLSRGEVKKTVAPAGYELSLSHDGKKLLFTARSDWSRSHDCVLRCGHGSLAGSDHRSGPSGVLVARRFAGGILEIRGSEMAGLVVSGKCSGQGSRLLSANRFGAARMGFAYYQSSHLTWRTRTGWARMASPYRLFRSKRFTAAHFRS